MNRKQRPGAPLVRSLFPQRRGLSRRNLRAHIQLLREPLEQFPPELGNPAVEAGCGAALHPLKKSGGPSPQVVAEAPDPVLTVLGDHPAAHAFRAVPLPVRVELNNMVDRVLAEKWARAA